VARIFISSTTEDLRAPREAAREALTRLRHTVLVIEDLAPTAHGGPLYQSRATIASCDLFVAIIGWRYGYIPPEDNPDRRSFVELEFRHARDLGKPRLVFMLKDDVPWPPQFIESGEGAERLQAFRREVMTDVLVGWFTSPSDLAEKLTAAVARWETEWRQAANAPSEVASESGLPTNVDPFDLAWRLVVDRKADPALLRHMDPKLLKEAVERWTAEGSPKQSVAGETPYEAALGDRQARQRNLAPNGLWLAWMRTTKAHLLRAGDDSSREPGAVPNRHSSDRSPDKGSPA